MQGRFSRARHAILELLPLVQHLSYRRLRWMPSIFQSAALLLHPIFDLELVEELLVHEVKH